jgi:hypothetical protein
MPTVSDPDMPKIQVVAGLFGPGWLVTMTEPSGAMSMLSISPGPRARS